MAIKRAILLLAHGSRQPEASEPAREIARRLHDRLPDRAVRVAHLELTPPLLPEAIDECVRDGAEEVVVQPYLLAPGRHSTRDIPDLLSAARQRHPQVAFRLGEVLGVDDKLVDLVAARVAEAEPFDAPAPSDPESER